MPARRVINNNRRSRIIGVRNSAPTFSIQSIGGTALGTDLIIAFTQPLLHLPAWEASALTITNNGAPKADSAWSLTAPNEITVTVAALTTGEIEVTLGGVALTLRGTNGGLLNQTTFQGGVGP